MRRNTLRHIVLGIIAVLVSCQIAIAQTTTTVLPGIAEQKPAEGRFVALDNGRFMVPYVEKVPGTDIGFEMEPIPGGTFKLGSPDSETDRNDDEGPQVEIQVEPFWIGKYEVRWREYRKFMDLYNIAKRRSEPIEMTAENKAIVFTIPTPLYDPSFTFALGEELDQPAVTMSHYAARQYTKWLSLGSARTYRLPTEVEWEYACRAGSAAAYGFGADPGALEDYAWYFDNSDDTYHEVGQKQPNAWGLHDMHGNVAEMVLDGYTADHYQTLTAGQDAWSAIRWPEKVFKQVVRGGSWDSDAEELRSAARSITRDWRLEDPNLPKSPWWFTDEEALSVGFRVARSLRPIEADASRVWDADVKYLQQDVDARVSEGRGVYDQLQCP